MDKVKVLEQCERKISATCDRIGAQIPYIAKADLKYNTDMREKDLAWWTNGFYPGILWLMYKKSGDDKYKQAAEDIEQEFDKLFLDGFLGLHHDVGFMWLHTAVANYRDNGNERSFIRGVHAANILSARYNANGEFLVAWNDESGWMIVDSLMNIPLLYWATRETEDERFASIANKHLETVLKHVIREDGSCNHICSFDPKTGEYIESIGGQGYGVGSSWTRGQAWVAYGMTQAYKNTQDERFLAAARKTANYFIANIIEHDFVSPVDFRSPSEPLLLDTTATAIVASALVDLSKVVCEQEGVKYLHIATKMLEKLNNDFCNYDTEYDSILQKGSEKYFNDAIDPEVAIIYGDYFYIEALMKLNDYKIEMW